MSRIAVIVNIGFDLAGIQYNSSPPRTSNRGQDGISVYFSKLPFPTCTVYTCTFCVFIHPTFTYNSKFESVINIQ